MGYNLTWYYDNQRYKLTEKAKNFIEQTEQRVIGDFGTFESADAVNDFVEEYQNALDIAILALKEEV